METDNNSGEIELEEGNERVSIQIPFDPNDIKVKTQPLTLGDLVDRLDYEEIKMDTEFQRLPNLWDNTKKSRFIESLLLKLPIPTFYFDAQDDNLWRVIDGLQRISTLQSFILEKDEKKKLVLQDLEFLKEFEGATFEQLPRDLQRRIKTFPITVYILEKGTPDIVKFNIFRRINQGGLILTPQEIRHAIHQGTASNLVAELVKPTTVEGQAFIRATEGKIKSVRMEDRDFATRFVAFYITPYQEYQPDLDSFMNLGMEKIKDINNQLLQQLKADFKKAMDTAYVIFGNDAFRKRFKLGDTRKPINKALFDTLSTHFAKLSIQNCQALIEKKETFKEKLRNLLNQQDQKFFRAITQGTAQKENVERRFQDIEKIIKETLQNA